MRNTRPTHVFIVDDSASIRMRLARLLASMPDVALVGEAASPSEAVAEILRVRPDSVLLDLKLLGGTGLEVLRQVRPQAPGIAFVVLTNHSEAQYRDACLEAGARYFLDKCGDIDQVPAVIAEIAATCH